MSWVFSVPAVPKAEFDAAVDKAEAIGNVDSDLAKQHIAAAKEHMKALGKLVVRDRVSGNAGGHALLPEDGANFYDGISVSVNGLG
jgi:hypothetical protein